MSCWWASHDTWLTPVGNKILDVPVYNPAATQRSGGICSEVTVQTDLPIRKISLCCLFAASGLEFSSFGLPSVVLLCQSLLLESTGR